MGVMKLKLMDDSFIYFDSTPVTIRNDKGEEIKIYGITYNRHQSHEEDLWVYMVNYYTCYLQACERVQTKGGELSPDEWRLSNGNRISLQRPHKNLIYRLMREDVLGYRLVETDGPLDIREDEIDGKFIISNKPLIRMGLEKTKNKKETEVKYETESK